MCSSSSSSFSRSSHCSSSSIAGPAASREVASTRLSRAGGADGTGLARGTQGPPRATAASLWGRTALALRRRRGCGTGALPPLPSLLSHTMKREVALSLGSHLPTHSAPVAFTCSLRRRCARCGCASSRCSSSRCSPGTSTRCTSRSGARRTMRYSSLRRRPDRSHRTG